MLPLDYPFVGPVDLPFLVIQIIYSMSVNLNVQPEFVTKGCHTTCGGTIGAVPLKTSAGFES